MERMKKILILCNTGLGNIILFLPAYHALKKAFPASQFTIALDSRWYGDEFFVEQFGKEISFRKFPSNEDGRLCQIRCILKLRRSNFDLILMPYSGPSWRLAMLLLSVKSRERIFFETKAKWLNRRFNQCLLVVDGEHYLERNMRQVRALEIDGEVPTDRWIVTSDDHVKRLRYKKSEKIWVGIHPGINAEFNEARQWPTTHFAKLLDKILAESNTKAVLFGRGGNERSMIHSLIKGREQRCLSAIDCQLDEVAAYLSLCDVFVGNDSGLMNLAVGLGVPTTIDSNRAAL